MKKIIKKLDKKLKVIDYKYERNTLIINIERNNKSDICPNCRKRSSSVHSMYVK